MDKELYLNFAVYNNGKTDYLVKANDSHFASEAWMESDEKYYQISGTKFSGLFGDTGKCQTCDKMYIRRLSSNEEYHELYKSSCLMFKQMMKLFEIMERMLHEHDWSTIGGQIVAYQNMIMFSMFGSAILADYADVNPDDPENKDWFEKVAFAFLNKK